MTTTRRDELKRVKIEEDIQDVARRKILRPPPCTQETERAEPSPDNPYEDIKDYDR